MNVSSLGFRTDLALLTASGSVVEDRGTHLVVRTPDNPTYYWGNFILLAEPPVPGGEREVVGAFHTEFPEARHVSIGIDTPDLTPEARAAFEAAGLVVDVASVLTASELQPPREVEAEVRPLQSASDWESRAPPERRDRGARRRGVAPAVRSRAQRAGAVARRRRPRHAVRRLRRRTRSSAPQPSSPPRTGSRASRAWRRTSTHRRKGLAAAAVHAAGRYALEHLGARTLVIVADDDGEAIGIYRRLGFADTERQLMLERRHGDRASLDG